MNSVFLKDSFLEVLVAEQSRGGPEAESAGELREHGVTALFCSVRGRCRVKIAVERVEVRQETMLLLKPRTPYRLELDLQEGALLLIFLIGERGMELLDEPAFARRSGLWDRLPFDAAISLQGVSARLGDEILNRLYMEISSDVQDEAFLFSALRLLLMELTRCGTAMSAPAGKSPSVQSSLSRLIKQALRHIDIHYRDRLGLSEISEALHVNPSYLSRVFKNSVGVGIVDYVNARRIFEAKRLLVSTDMKISDIALQVGYSNIPYFNIVFMNSAGCSPREFRARAHA
jgi:AraC-like DNA-binding protein